MMPDYKVAHKFDPNCEICRSVNPERAAKESPSVECFFCSGHMPCREHKPEVFYDLDLQEYLMGSINGDELALRQPRIWELASSVE